LLKAVGVQMAAGVSHVVWRALKNPRIYLFSGGLGLLNMQFRNSLIFVQDY
jgi:hypothetical protein